MYGVAGTRGKGESCVGVWNVVLTISSKIKEAGELSKGGLGVIPFFSGSVGLVFRLAD